MKHAFLVMAHTNFELLGRILRKIDHVDNTIFLHIDAKSEFSQEDEKRVKNECKYSDIYIIDRYKCTWGGYSMVNCELRLLEQAVQGKFDYYHLMSGADFLIKPMKYFHSFFESYAGCEFVNFSSDEFIGKEYTRWSLYHFLIDKVGRNRKNLLFWIEKISLRIQKKILKINRAKKYSDIVFKHGANWCSITHDFAEYILSKEEEIKRMFSYSISGDELYVQTVIYNSPFRFNLYSEKYGVTGMDSCLRSIDWKRGDKKMGSPYTYVIDDYDDLIKSPNLICRKITDKTEEGNALIKKLEKL